MPKYGVLRKPASSIISKFFETFEGRGAQMVPMVFLYQIKSNFFPARDNKNYGNFMRLDLQNDSIRLKTI